MNPTQNYLYYKTPTNEFQTHYPNKNLLFKDKICSQFPRIVAVMRAAFASLVATLILSKETPWVWTVGVGCLAYSIWTLYNSFIRKDPLVEAFHKIVGGPEKYEKLPEFKLVGKTSVDEELKKIDWDRLKHPLYKATAENGCRILIVRALSRYPEQDLCSNSQVKTIYAFVEKLEDDIFFMKLVDAMNLTKSENDTGYLSTFSSSSKGTYKAYVNASIDPELANEFTAQV